MPFNTWIFEKLFPYAIILWIFFEYEFLVTNALSAVIVENQKMLVTDFDQSRNFFIAKANTRCIDDYTSIVPPTTSKLTLSDK